MLIRRFLAGLFLLCALSAALPAEAGGFFSRVKGGPAAAPPPTVPTVTPGVAAVPTINTIASTNFGNPADVGYGVRGWGRYTAPQLVEIGSSGVAGTMHIGAVFAHEATNAELFSGVASNICSVDVRADGGAWFNIPAETVNPDAGGITDWNAIFRSQDFADGLHQVDFVGKPCTGPNIIMQGPLEDASHYAPAKIGAATIDNGSGSAGNILTVTANVQNINNTSGSAVLVAGYSITGMGVGPNTFIDGTSTVNASSCVAETGVACTGAGNLGKYHTRSPASQLVASNPMMAGNERSFFFITDFNNTLGRGTHVVYVAAAGASPAGNDANAGTAAAPKLTIASAEGVIYANDSVGHGRYGGTICLMDGVTIASESGSGNYPVSTLGYTIIQGADHAPCVHPGDTGNPTVHFDGVSRTYVGLRGWYRWMNFDGHPDTGNVGSATSLVAEHVSLVQNVYTGSVLGNGGIACLETSIVFAYGGGCNADLIRNHTGTYYSEDGAHGPTVILGSNYVGGGPTYFWATGTATTGSSVITNATPPAGYTLSQMFKIGGVIPAWNCYADSQGCIGVADPNNGYGSCFPTSDPSPPTPTSETLITAIDDVAHTITTNRLATCAVTNGPLMFPGVHGDGSQHQVNLIYHDIYFRDDNFGMTWPGRQQGLFIQNSPGRSGVYVGRTNWKNANTPEKIIAVDGGNEKFIYENNTWTGGSTGQDGFVSSNDETFAGDKCMSGQSFNGVGTNIRRHQAATNACYTSIP